MNSLNHFGLSFSFSTYKHVTRLFIFRQSLLVPHRTQSQLPIALLKDSLRMRTTLQDYEVNYRYKNLIQLYYEFPLGGYMLNGTLPSGPVLSQTKLSSLPVSSKAPKISEAVITSASFWLMVYRGGFEYCRAPFEASISEAGTISFLTLAEGSGLGRLNLSELEGTGDVGISSSLSSHFGTSKSRFNRSEGRNRGFVTTSQVVVAPCSDWDQIRFCATRIITNSGAIACRPVSSMDQIV